jgi:hypothetical protein
MLNTRRIALRRVEIDLSSIQRVRQAASLTRRVDQHTVNLALLLVALPNYSNLISTFSIAYSYLPI